MRLLYVVVDDLNPSPDELERLRCGGQEIVGAGSEFVVKPIPVGPREYSESALGLSLAVPGALKLVVEQESKFDAAILGCFGDPGLRALRACTDLPIIGPAEAATSLVQILARRFGIVTIMESDIPEIAVYLSTLEVTHKCVGITAIERPFYDLVKDPEDTSRLLEASGRALLDRGAEAVILGCMSFGFYPFARKLSKRLGVPVVDPLRAAVATARSLSILGTNVSRRTSPLMSERGAAEEFVAGIS